MCGIAGLVRKDGGLPDESIVSRMNDAVMHRGPDGAGLYCAEEIALGHRRLSVIDLSEAGAQPMVRRRLAITYNGEIYNYQELREQLMKLGHEFHTDTDTEVILAAYEEWGSECTGHFNGMWAFAIHDKSRRRLFCSRDRFGIKPFYYLDQSDIFAFGSEIRQLLPLLATREADLDRVKMFLVAGAIELDNYTLFHGVLKLPPGHNAIFNISSGTFRIERYYQLSRRSDVEGISVEDASRQFLSLLESSVHLRLRSDVRVGTCLSGGLDSSSVATLAAARHRLSSGERFCGITAVSEEPDTDESDYARMVATKTGIELLNVKPTYENFRDDLMAVVAAQEEPFGSPSLIMQHFVMRTARANNITVLLDGQGGDEVLLGYDKYLGAYFAEILRTRGVIAAARALRAVIQNNDNLGPISLCKYIVGSRLSQGRYNAYKWQHRYIPNMPSRARHIDQFSRAGSDHFALQDLEIRSTNLPVLLRYEDKNSMAHGVEARLPFLDYRLVEFAVSLPIMFKIRCGWSKWLLRSVMSQHLPHEVAWRRNKMSFDAPERTWLGRHLPEMMDSVRRSDLLGEIAPVSRLIEAYPGLDFRSQWRLYSVALWERQFCIIA